MTSAARPVVETTDGRVRGTLTDDACVYWNIPFAAPPIGARRFASPEPHGGWAAIRDCSSPGAAVPQPVSRLAGVMGEARRLQDEATSLTVNVFAPAAPGHHSVLFWIHGGGFSSGSGGWPWYDATRFAARHQVVVVTVNYRLGPLGFLYLPELVDGLGAGNFGIHDQRLALQWVSENIDAFGGDRSRITVGGQSAGALSAAALVSSDSTRSLVQGALMQSPPASTMVHTTARATERARMMLDLLDVRPRDAVQVLRRLPAEAFVDASLEMAGMYATFAEFDPVFAPTEDRALGLLSRPGGLLAATGAADRVPVLIGTTARETAAFLCQDPTYPQLGMERVSAWFGGVLGDRGPSALEAYQDAYPRYSAAELLVAATTDRSFVAETLQIATQRARRGHETWVYQFDWGPADSPFGACHCIELPFLFDTFAAFEGAPMLGSGPTPHQLTDQFQRAVANHLRAAPAPAEESAWPGYRSCSGVLHLTAEQPEVRQCPMGTLEALWI